MLQISTLSTIHLVLFPFHWRKWRFALPDRAERKTLPADANRLDQ
jgi:hypothetical protein